MLDTVYMEDFMTYYIVNNALTSINAFTMRETFANFVETFFNPDSSMVNSILEKVNWEEWIYVVGLDPTGTLNFTTDGSTQAQNLANAYIALNGTASPPNASLYYHGYTSNLKVCFHDVLQ